MRGLEENKKRNLFLYLNSTNIGTNLKRKIVKKIENGKITTEQEIDNYRPENIVQSYGSTNNRNFKDSLKDYIKPYMEIHMQELEETRKKLLKLKKYFERVDIEEYNNDEEKAIEKALDIINQRLKSEEYNESLDNFHINHAKEIIHEKEIEKREREYEEYMKKKIIKEGKIKIREINKQLSEVQKPKCYEMVHYQNLLKEKKELLEQIGIMEKIEEKVIKEIEEKEEENEQLRKKACPECSHSLNEVDEKCPYCGHILHQEKIDIGDKEKLKRIVDNANLNIFKKRELKIEINKGHIFYESYLREKIQEMEKEEKINNDIEKWVKEINEDRIEALLLNKDISKIIKEKETKLSEITEKIEKCKKLERYEEAIEYIDEAIELNPSNENLLESKVFCLLKLESYGLALEYINKYLKLNPSNDSVWYAKSNLVGEWEGIVCLDRAIELNPSNEIYWREKASRVRRNGRTIEALGCYDKLIELDPNNPSYWNEKAICFYSLGRYEEANESYEKAESLKD